MVGDKGLLSRVFGSEDYVRLVEREIAATSKLVPSLASDVRRAGGLRTVYFGGGTPSLLDPPLLKCLMNALREQCGGLAAGCEVTLEMDPGTFDEARLDAYLKDCGVNRVSLGVQSWDAGTLTAAGRAHTVADAENAVRLLAAAHDDWRARSAQGGGGGYKPGLRTWSLDLISGLPTQPRRPARGGGLGSAGAVTGTDSRADTGANAGPDTAGNDEQSAVDTAAVVSWDATLARTVAWARPPHVSAYDLQLEPGTAFGRWYLSQSKALPSLGPKAAASGRGGKARASERSAGCGLPSEACAAELYRMASRALAAAGYEHYEVSSFARLSKGQTQGPAGNEEQPKEGPSAPNPGTVAMASSPSVLGQAAAGSSPHRSRHNAAYWALSPFLGVGLGATSMLRPGRRAVRPRTMAAYRDDWVGPLERAAEQAAGTEAPGHKAGEVATVAAAGCDASGRRAWAVSGRRVGLGMLFGTLSAPRVGDGGGDGTGGESVWDGGGDDDGGASRFELLLEGLMVALRCADGVDLDAVALRFGPAAADAVEKALLGLCAGGATGGAPLAKRVIPFKVGCRGAVRLTDPGGFLFSNTAIGAVFAALDPGMVD